MFIGVVAFWLGMQSRHTTSPPFAAVTTPVNTVRQGTPTAAAPSEPVWPHFPTPMPTTQDTPVPEVAAPPTGTPDEKYFGMLEQSHVRVLDRGIAKDNGFAACKQLAQGVPWTQILSDMGIGAGVPRPEAAVVLAAATYAYCPQYKGIAMAALREVQAETGP